jgi:endonuclease/exonuclease/phosphatase family metal-dependent hydrolase
MEDGGVVSGSFRVVSLGRVAPLLRVSFLIVAACGAAVADDGNRAPADAPALLPCRQILTPSGDLSPSGVQWHEHEGASSRPTLDAWCRGVGPVVYQSQPANGPDEPVPVRATDAIAVVSWNVNVGAGNLSAFVADLRAGKWSDGNQPEHFVLLLQEVLRTGETVPPRDPSQAGARRLLRRPPRVDIVGFAREFGLSLLYVPSMRNGLDASAPSEDRGNAILSTLPLLVPGALELPFVRQRRVAAFAMLDGPGDRDSLGVASVHLDPFVGANRLWVFGAARARGRQARAIAAALRPQAPFVVGGDFNTWLGADEPALREMTQFSGQAAQARQGTYKSGAVLDYLFFRTSVSEHPPYERADDLYGSDHYPLVGWISLGHAPGCPC